MLLKDSIISLVCIIPIIIKINYNYNNNYNTLPIFKIIILMKIIVRCSLIKINNKIILLKDRIINYNNMEQLILKDKKREVIIFFDKAF